MNHLSPSEAAMKKIGLIAFASMFFAVSSAMAGGSNLAWNDCIGGGGTLDRTVACTNSGSGFVYVTLNPSQSYPNVGATDVFLYVAPAVTIGTWWNPTPTTTRFGSAATDPASGACTGWWSAAPNGGLTFQPPQAILTGGNKLSLRITTVIGAGEEQPMDPGTEYFMGSLLLKFNAGTLGNPECDGGAAIATKDIVVFQPGQSDSHENQTADVSNCVTFRNPPNKQCPGATPTEKSTWGSIKALYR